jgi:hypothetical protein
MKICQTISAIKTAGLLPLSLLILLLALPACSKAPPQASDIAGTWEIVETDMSGTLVLRPDGTFTADTNAGVLEGTWKIEDDRLVGMVSKSTVPNISMGYSWVSVVDHLSDAKLALTNKSGETESYKRVK